jgi:hypothetical protein
LFFVCLLPQRPATYVRTEFPPNTYPHAHPRRAVPHGAASFFYSKTSNCSLFALVLANNVPAYANELPTLRLTDDDHGRIGWESHHRVLATPVDITQKTIFCLIGPWTTTFTKTVRACGLRVVNESDAGALTLRKHRRRK